MAPVGDDGGRQRVGFLPPPHLSTLATHVSQHLATLPQLAPLRLLLERYLAEPHVLILVDPHGQAVAVQVGCDVRLWSGWEYAEVDVPCEEPEMFLSWRDWGSWGYEERRGSRRATAYDIRRGTRSPQDSTKAYVMTTESTAGHGMFPDANTVPTVTRSEWSTAEEVVAALAPSAATEYCFCLARPFGTLLEFVNYLRRHEDRGKLATE